MKSTIPVVLFLAILPLASVADSKIYKSTDTAGRTLYSSKPKSDKDTPAVLPTIERRSINPNAHLKSCLNHGGIKCDKGADSDGSVVCSDGFKDSAQLYVFSCSDSRLEIVDIQGNGETPEFKVFLRNTTAVRALLPEVRFRKNTSKKISLSGPQSIEPFGVGEFLLFDVKEAPKLSDLSVTCKNCN